MEGGGKDRSEDFEDLNPDELDSLELDPLEKLIPNVERTGREGGRASKVSVLNSQTMVKGEKT